MITLALVFLPDRLAPSASASTSAGISLSNVSRASASRARFPADPPVPVPVVVVSVSTVSTVSTVVSVITVSVSIVSDVSIDRRSIDPPSAVVTVAHDARPEWVQPSRGVGRRPETRPVSRLSLASLSLCLSRRERTRRRWTRRDHLSTRSSVASRVAVARDVATTTTTTRRTRSRDDATVVGRGGKTARWARGGLVYGSRGVGLGGVRGGGERGNCIGHSVRIGVCV